MHCLCEKTDDALYKNELNRLWCAEKKGEESAVSTRFAMWATEKKTSMRSKSKKVSSFFSVKAFANKTFFVDLQHQASK